MTAIKAINLVILAYVLLCIKDSAVCDSEQQLSLQESVTELMETTKALAVELKNTKHQLSQLFFKSKDTSVPAGTVTYFANTNCAKGWLTASGQPVSRESYKKLFAAIGTTFGSGDGSTTFTLPDLRGEFIRSWSDGSSVDTGRVFGSFQWGSSIPYASKIYGNGNIASADGYYQIRAFAGKTFDGDFQYNIAPNAELYGMTFNGWNNTFTGVQNDIVVVYTPTTQSGKISEWSILQGTRPRNIALLACIKY